MIKIGSLNISDLKLGSNQIAKAYLGLSLVWQKEEPEPEPTPIGYHTMTVNSSGANITLTYGDVVVTGSGTASATVESGTEVTYTVTNGADTRTNTVNVDIDTTITIDLAAETYTYNAGYLVNQDTKERVSDAYVRVIYSGYNASFPLPASLKIPVGTTANLIVYAKDMEISSQTSASSSSSASFYNRVAKLLTVTRTPATARVVVKDQYGYIIPSQSDSGGVATYYQPQYKSSTNDVTVTVSKDGYTTKEVTYTPTYQQAKSLTINL